LNFETLIQVPCRYINCVTVIETVMLIITLTANTAQSRYTVPGAHLWQQFILLRAELYRVFQKNNTQI